MNTKTGFVFLITLFFFKFPFISSQIRYNIPVSGEWSFFKGDINTKKPEGISWETVTIPHTWNKEDGTGGQNREYYQGIGTYTKNLVIPSSLKDKRLFLRFEAVSSYAEVYLNGKFLGKHDNAFNAFCFEITSIVKAGDNELLVKATNEWNENIAPLAGDFTVFGGIYRPVWLIALNDICITPLDYASSGIYVTQTKITDDQAILDVKTKVNNATKSTENIKLKYELYDMSDNLVVSASKKIIINKKGTTDVDERIIVDNPILWQGKEDPYLYKIVVKVEKNDEVLDFVSQNIGLRYFSIDPKDGFFLNGISHNIRGVNRHQDREGMGWAITNKEHDEDMALIKEIGANGVRLAHYPHSSYFYDLCDQNGILVWAEVPFIERATETKAFADNIKNQMAELIRQNYNHPSIFCWGLFNELNKGNPESIVAELNNLAHREDATRFTVAAPNVEKRPENMIADYSAYNTYPGWYWADPETMGGSLENWNNLIGNKGICVSEYGAGASIHHHEQGVSKAPKTDGPWHPEEWQAIVHEGNYKHIKRSNFVWGSFVWNMFDFAVASRNEGDTPGINDKGLVTYDRRIRKDAFFYYKANWSEEPVIYITSRRHIERTDATTDVKVYSNAKGLRLLVNNKDMGTTTGEDCTFIWKNITLKKGANDIKVVGRFGQNLVEDICTWNLE